MTDADDTASVITIDGPSGAGKGTVAQRLARHLGWHFLDSGALYRLLALSANRSGVPGDEGAALAARADELHIEFRLTTEESHPRVLLDGDDVTDDIRSDDVGQRASRVASLPEVRQALVARQRAFRCAPGLVADGRDMGTVVFPDAPLKIFLDASAAERARRRHKQLMEKGLSASLPALERSIAERDDRDRTRAAAPLRPAPDAVEIDSTDLDVDQVFERVLAEVRRCGLAA